MRRRVSKKKRQFLSARECAEIMGLSTSYIYDAINHGHLRAYREHSGTTTPWRIKKKDFKQWLEQTSSLNFLQNHRQGGIYKLYAAVHGEPILNPEWWAKQVEALPERTRYILKRRYGLDGDKPAMLSELSEELCLSRARIRQKQREAEAELRKLAKGGNDGREAVGGE